MSVVRNGCLAQTGQFQTHAVKNSNEMIRKLMVTIYLFMVAHGRPFYFKTFVPVGRMEKGGGGLGKKAKYMHMCQNVAATSAL